MCFVGKSLHWIVRREQWEEEEEKEKPNFHVVAVKTMLSLDLNQPLAYASLWERS